MKSSVKIRDRPYEWYSVSENIQFSREEEKQ